MPDTESGYSVEVQATPGDARSCGRSSPSRLSPQRIIRISYDAAWQRRCPLTPIRRSVPLNRANGDACLLSRCLPCTKPHVIPSRGDERSETPPCRGIFGHALTLSGRVSCQHPIIRHGAVAG